jgi:hypothetical protein
VDGAIVDATAKASPLWAKYAVEVDRDSARELLAAKMAAAAAAAPPPPATPAPAPAPAPSAGGGVQVPESPPRTSAPGPGSGSRSRSSKDDGNVVTDYLRSREGRSMVNTVVRGVFGMLKKR